MQIDRRRLMAGGALALAASASHAAEPRVPKALPKPYRQIGAIRRLDPALDALVADGAPVEAVAEGFAWCEGPTWVPQDGGYLLFSDPRANQLWRWSEAGGLKLVMQPSGYAGPPSPMLAEQGSNGLMYYRGAVLLCDSGNRALCRYDPKTGRKSVIVSSFQGKRLNSTNDVIAARDGTIYFTDPPYGLKGALKSSAKELDFSGVFRLRPNGELSVIDRSLPLPNGIGLSPDEKTLYVAEYSLGWAAYDLTAADPAASRRDFGKRPPGNFGPDGLTVSTDGAVWATGPAGMQIFDPTGKRIGTFESEDLVSNNTFAPDGYLYLTVNHTLARVKVKAKGLA